jgi:hypothetical protein
MSNSAKDHVALDGYQVEYECFLFRQYAREALRGRPSARVTTPFKHQEHV